MSKSIYQSQVGDGGGIGPSKDDEILKNVWGNKERVNLMQEIWERIPASSSRDKLRKSSVGSSSVGSDSTSDEDRASSPANLTMEQKKAGRILMSQVFNGLEYLEMDRITYENKVGIGPLAPFRELLRASELDVPSVIQMLSEAKRHFELHTSFVSAMFKHLEKIRKDKKGEPNEHELFWIQMGKESDIARAKQGLPPVEDVLYKEENKKAANLLIIKNFVSKVNGQWMRDMKQIHDMIVDPAVCRTAQLKNLELMPFHLDKLSKDLDAARFGIYAIYFEIMLELGKSPNPDNIDLKAHAPEPPFKTCGEFRWWESLSSSTSGKDSNASASTASGSSPTSGTSRGSEKSGSNTASGQSRSNTPGGQSGKNTPGGQSRSNTPVPQSYIGFPASQSRAAPRGRFVYNPTAAPYIPKNYHPRPPGPPTPQPQPNYILHGSLRPQLPPPPPPHCYQFQPPMPQFFFRGPTPQFGILPPGSFPFPPPNNQA